MIKLIIKMKLKLLFLTLFCSVIGWGQIYQHDFGTTAISAHPYTVAPAIFDANLNSSSWTNSNGAWTSFAGSAGQAISLSNSCLFSSSIVADSPHIFPNLLFVYSFINSSDNVL